MKCVRKLTAGLLALAMVLTLFSGVAPVKVRAESDDYDAAPEDARVEALPGIRSNPEPMWEKSGNAFGMMPETSFLAEPDMDAASILDPLDSQTEPDTDGESPLDPLDSQTEPEDPFAFLNDLPSIADAQIPVGSTGENAISAVNPRYPDMPSEEELSLPADPSFPEDISTVADPTYLDGPTQAALALREAMVNREASAAIYFTTTSSPDAEDGYVPLAVAIINYAFNHTGVVNEGDYLDEHVNNWSGNIGYRIGDDGITAYCELSLDFEYLTTASQESQVASQATRLLSALNVDYLTYPEKLEAVYDYLCANVEYIPREEATSLLDYSAYGALINQQATSYGFSTLFYRLALEMGMDARIINGSTADSEYHSWNIVNLNGLYYNLDAALDAGYASYNYFLMGANDFTGHTRKDKYTSSDFQNAYPMAAAKYQNNGIAINSTNFPDANFRSYVSSSLDKDSNGYLSQTERACTEINVAESSITNLKGIEYFEDLLILYCYGNELTSLDVSRNTALAVLGCSRNSLTELDVTNNPALIWLNCGENQLSSLDVAYNTVLETLYCYDNQLSSLDVTYNTALITLSCGNSVDEKTGVQLGKNQLTRLDVSRNTALNDLRCGYTKLTSLNVTKNTALTYLGCEGNQITQLDLSRNRALETLYCYENALSSLSITKNTALTLVSCFSNRLTNLNTTQNTALEYLYCHDNQLRTLDVSKNLGLTYLSCQRNQLSKVDVSKNTALKFLYSYNNPLTTNLDVSKNTRLVELSCSNNQLTTLDLSQNPALQILYCYENTLTSLDLSRNPALGGLSCRKNKLTSLDLSANTALQTLECNGNQLTTLNVSNCGDLTFLNCEANQLTSLDLSSNNSLTTFSAKNNAYQIKLDNRKSFNLTKLPGNFQVRKASNWANANVSGNVLTVKNNASWVTYLYDCGNNFEVTFTLNTGASPVSGNVKRVSGNMRFDTAIETADALKTALGVSKFDNIILASGGRGGKNDTGFADALAGSYLAIAKKAPILLHYGRSQNVNLPYIQNNLKAGGTVYILGGTGAVPNSVVTDLRNIGVYNIKRLGGADRFETNLAILEEAGVSSNQEILVSTGWNYADALSISATGLPVLLLNTANGQISAAQRTFLRNHRDNMYTFIGSEAAVSSQMQYMVESIIGSSTNRIYGDARESTSVAVAETYFNSPDFAVVAYSRNFPDGLCGGPLAYYMNAPMLLTNVNQAQINITNAYLTDKGIISGYVMGGADILSDAVVKAVFGITASGVIPPV